MNSQEDNREIDSNRDTWKNNNNSKRGNLKLQFLKQLGWYAQSQFQSLSWLGAPVYVPSILPVHLSSETIP